MKKSAAPSRKPKSALDQALQLNRIRLRQNEKRQQQLTRQMDTMDSLRTIVEGLKAKLAAYSEQAVVQIMPENDAHAGVIAQLFPAKTRLTTKGDAIRRLDHYLQTMRLRRSALESRRQDIEHYHSVLQEAHSVTSQLRQLKQQKRAAAEARKRAKKAKSRSKQSSGQRAAKRRP